ncbi:hypothetical protein BU24DRAFT_456664 [Aaosphaeria arxii CBS 175.79]|uniref:Uncharacterized protein n=1 Tax=Aaosphaeria arxii CBS 175.79 TaxID=1450172 RepID=A0A6A5Y4U4_9PLEO|nr:uncharacterized protein BU24DRAFT_456664 [Aaosphaeria arxii CBS 175.79]KAF2020605.1 hypothetical protein BU24DRAFT_456664 [Aaosphaeria arxii CBS 175.79]
MSSGHSHRKHGESSRQGKRREKGESRDTRRSSRHTTPDPILGDIELKDQSPKHRDKVGEWRENLQEPVTPLTLVARNPDGIQSIPQSRARYHNRESLGQHSKQLSPNPDPLSHFDLKGMVDNDPDMKGQRGVALPEDTSRDNDPKKPRLSDNLQRPTEHPKGSRPQPTETRDQERPQQSGRPTNTTPGYTLPGQGSMATTLLPSTKARSGDSSPVRPESSYSNASTIRRVTPSPESLSEALRQSFAAHSTPKHRHSDDSTYVNADEAVVLRGGEAGAAENTLRAQDANVGISQLSDSEVPRRNPRSILYPYGDQASIPAISTRKTDAAIREAESYQALIDIYDNNGNPHSRRGRHHSHSNSQSKHVNPNNHTADVNESRLAPRRKQLPKRNIVIPPPTYVARTRLPRPTTPTPMTEIERMYQYAPMTASPTRRDPASDMARYRARCAAMKALEADSTEHLEQENPPAAASEVGAAIIQEPAAVHHRQPARGAESPVPGPSHYQASQPATVAPRRDGRVLSIDVIEMAERHRNMMLRQAVNKLENEYEERQRIELRENAALNAPPARTTSDAVKDFGKKWGRKCYAECCVVM